MSRRAKYLYREDIFKFLPIGERQAGRILKQLPGAECYDGVHYRVRDCQDVRVALGLYRQKSLQRGETPGNDWLNDFKRWSKAVSSYWEPDFPKVYGSRAWGQLVDKADRLLDQMEPVREFFEKVEGWRRQALDEAQKRSASPRGTARR